MIVNTNVPNQSRTISPTGRNGTSVSELWLGIGHGFMVVYGKWPFYRFGPVQEPFSVLMSIFNLWANLTGVKELLRRVRPENQLRKWLLMAGVAQINTWIWSTVFHTRGQSSSSFRHYAS